MLRALQLPDGGSHWYWPSGGNGDRGPLGAWQMNLNAGGMPAPELVAFSAVYACTTIISGDIAKLPAQVFKIDMATGARELQRADYYARLMREPNDYQTAADFMQLYVLSVLLQGNAYAFVRRDARGRVNEMHVLDPRTTRPYVEPETGTVFYRVGDNLLAGLQSVMVPERDIIHHRLPLLPAYPLVGVTPVFAAASSSAVGLHILRNSQSFFGNASRPAGVLTAPGKVSKDTADRLKEDWDNNYSGQRYGKTAVLPDGLKWEPLTITAQDAQLIEQLRWSVEDVGRVFRVPPFMLGDTAKTTYRNSEQLGRSYLTGCLSYHLETLEQRFRRAFEMPENYELRFDLSTLLRAEIDVRYAAYQTALSSAWATINEVRAQEGLGPVKGGDEPHIQMQYVPLSAAGETPEPPPAPPQTPVDPAQDAIDPTLVRAALRQRLRRAA